MDPITAPEGAAMCAPSRHHLDVAGFVLHPMLLTTLRPTMLLRSTICSWGWGWGWGWSINIAQTKIVVLLQLAPFGVLQ